jgi:hypothetical protein
MRGRGVWVLGGLLVGCAARPTPAPVAPAPAPVPTPAFSEVRPLRNETTEKTCSLPHEIVIAARDNELSVNGATLEPLPLPPSGSLPFVDLLLPCRGEHHFIFEFAPELPASQVAAIFAHVPWERSAVWTLRIGNAREQQFRVSPMGNTTGHWVRIVARSDRFEALEVKQESTDPHVSPKVAHRVDLRALDEAVPFMRATCSKNPCVGLILSLGPEEAKAAFLETALQAIGSNGAPVPVVELNDPSRSNDSNAFSTSGQLPPELIQSVVRKSYDDFRTCYEQGLARNSKLEGRVSVRFVIERDGSVQHSSNAGSELPDAEAVKCVITKFLALKFPPPDGGIVTVVYPIMFSPG